jgi:DNA helicase HerA-like ATPase
MSSKKMGENKEFLEVPLRVHRIQNPEDLSHIRQITPHISETILKRLPSIPTQHALIFGHAVNLPTTFKVNTADSKPKSDNNEISKNWFREKEFIVNYYETI